MKIQTALGLFSTPVAFAQAFFGFQKLAFFGFPDSHVTAYENAVRMPLTSVYFLQILFGLFFAVNLIAPRKFNFKPLLFYFVFIMFFINLAIADVIIPWYYLKQLGLDNGAGG